MNDKEFRKQRRRVRRAFMRLRDRLWLSDWFIDLAYTRGPLEVDGVLNADAVASCHVLWEYRQATMTFNLEKLAGRSKAYLENVIIHESCHVLVHEMREQPDPDLKHEERVVTGLTWALLRSMGKTIA